MPPFACRALPHGIYSLFPPALTSLAWIASSSRVDCIYARLFGAAVQELASDPATPFVDLGFNSFRQPILNPVTGQWAISTDSASPVCIPFPEDFEKDDVWLLAERLHVSAMVLGGLTTLVFWSSVCCVFSRSLWHLSGCLFLLAALMQSLTFLWFQTGLCHQDEESTCQLYYAAGGDMLATGFLVLASLLIFCWYPLPQSLWHYEDDDNVDVFHMAGALEDFFQGPEVPPATLSNTSSSERSSLDLEQDNYEYPDALDESDIARNEAKEDYKEEAKYEVPLGAAEIPGVIRVGDVLVQNDSPISDDFEDPVADTEEQPISDGDDQELPVSATDQPTSTSDQPAADTHMSQHASSARN